MSISIIVDRLMSSLSLRECRRSIRSAASIIDANREVDLKRLYVACKKSGVSEEISQFVLLSKGYRDDLEISDEAVLDNVRYNYPILMLCCVYSDMVEIQGIKKEEAFLKIEHKYPEIPVTYLTVFKNIV